MALPAESCSSQRRRWMGADLRPWEIAIVPGLLLLAIVGTWPLIQQPASAIPLGREGAATVPLFNLWTVWWNADRAAHGWRGYWDAPIFAPDRGAFALSEAQPTTLAVAPLVLATGSPAVGYNVYLLASLVLNGWMTYRLLKQAGVDRPIALCGAGMMAWLPMVYDHLGVLQLVPVWGILGTWSSLQRFVEAPAVGRGCRLGLWFSLTYLLCNYYGLFLSVLLGLIAPWMLGKKWLRRRTWTGLAAALVTAALIIGPIAAAQLQYLAQAGYRHSLELAEQLAARPAHYLEMPHSEFSMWRTSTGAGDRDHWPLSAGWLKSAIAAAGAVLGIASPRRRRLTLFLIAVAAAAFVLSISPRLRYGEVSLYEGLVQTWPGFAQVRSVYRFAIFVQLATVCLAAVGLDVIVQSSRRQRERGRPAVARTGLAAAYAAAVLCIAELPPPAHPLLRLPPPAEEDHWALWLRDNTPADAAVLCLPLAYRQTVEGYQETTEWMYWQTQHHRRLVNGYSGYFPERLSRLGGSLQDFPSETGLSQLAAGGVEYCVVRVSALSFDRQLRLEIVSGQAEIVHRDEERGYVILSLRPPVSFSRDALAERGPAAGATQRRYPFWQTSVTAAKQHKRRKKKYEYSSP